MFTSVSTRPFFQINNPCPNAGSNAAELLVATAIDRWAARGQRADNTSVIVVKLQEETDNTPIKGTHLSTDIEVGANVEIEDPEVLPPLIPSFSGLTPLTDKHNRSWKHKGVRKHPFKKTPAPIYRGRSPRSLSSRHRAMGYKTVRALARDELVVDPSKLDFVALSKSGVQIYRMKDAMDPSALPTKRHPGPRKSEEFVGVTKKGVTIVREYDPCNPEEKEEEEDVPNGNCRRVSVTKGGVTIYRDFSNNGSDNDVEVYDQDIDLGASCEVEDYKAGQVSPVVEMKKLPAV